MLKRSGGWLGRTLGYLLYGGGLLLLLLWLLFPRETIRSLLERQLNRIGGGAQWQLGEVGMDMMEMPPGLVLRSLEVAAAKGDKNPLARIDELTMLPHLLASLRSRSLEAGYRLIIAKGSVTGVLQYSGAKSATWADGTLRDVKLADIPLLSRQLGRPLSGVLSGTFAGSFEPVRDGRNTFESRLTVDKGILGLKRPILNHKEIPFSQGTVLLHGYGETLHLEQGKLESELFDARFSGMITLHGDPALSQIDIKGTLQPKNKFFKGLENTVAVQALRMQVKENLIPFRITGDLTSPGIHYEQYALLFQTIEKELK